MYSSPFSENENKQIKQKNHDIQRFQKICFDPRNISPRKLIKRNNIFKMTIST